MKESSRHEAYERLCDAENRRDWLGHKRDSGLRSVGRHLQTAGTGSLRNEIDLQIEEETGYRVSRHRIIVEGLCPDCRSCDKKE